MRARRSDLTGPDSSPMAAVSYRARSPGKVRPPPRPTWPPQYDVQFRPSLSRSRGGFRWNPANYTSYGESAAQACASQQDPRIPRFDYLSANLVVLSPLITIHRQQRDSCRQEIASSTHQTVLIAELVATLTRVRW
jgi:hypothetical protein